MNILPTVLLPILFSLSASAMCSTSETKTIPIAEGSVTATTTTVEPTPQKIEAVSSKERFAIEASASQAREFVFVYLPGVSAPSLRDFDEAFRLWQLDAERRYTDQQVVDLLGAHLGNRLATDFQMEWVVVTDEYGTDYAVRGKKFEVMSFPFSSVAKRIESKQHDFMVGVYYIVQHTIANGGYKAR